MKQSNNSSMDQELIKRISEKARQKRGDINPANLMITGDYNQLSTARGRNLYRFFTDSDRLRYKIESLLEEEQKGIEPDVIVYMKEVGDQINSFLQENDLRKVEFQPYWDTDFVIDDFSNEGPSDLGNNACVSIQMGVRPWGMGLKWSVVNHTYFMYFGPADEEDFEASAKLYQHPSTISYTIFDGNDLVPSKASWYNSGTIKKELTNQSNWLNPFIEAMSNPIFDDEITGLDILALPEDKHSALQNLMEF